MLKISDSQRAISIMAVALVLTPLLASATDLGSHVVGLSCQSHMSIENQKPKAPIPDGAIIESTVSVAANEIVTGGGCEIKVDPSNSGDLDRFYHLVSSYEIAPANGRPGGWYCRAQKQGSGEPANAVLLFYAHVIGCSFGSRAQ